MELRWYGRILRRQWNLIWRTVLVVAILSGLYTAYTYYTEHYKASATMEFSQKAPRYKTTSINIDPIGVANQNAMGASADAKLFSEGDSFFKGISAFLKSTYNMNMDYKNIHVGVTPNGDRTLKLDYSSNDPELATRLVQGSTYVLQHLFLPTYNLRLQQTNPGRDFTNNVYEPPIEMNPNFDPLNVRTLSKSSLILSWLLKVLVGLVLGIALAFLWEYLDESIHDEHDVRHWVDLPTLGIIPSASVEAA